ncbi:MAG: hypothetical protein R3B57_04325 [Phycisphaerales bacterium]
MDDRIERMLGGVAERAWPGPDHSDRVDAFLKEQAMSSGRNHTLSRTTIALIAAGVLGGGAVAAAVTHQVMSQRATIIADDGTRYDVELAPTPEGAGGTFVTDDGTVYGINMVENGEQRQMTVDIDSPKGGESTIIMEGASPRVLVAPGQKASVSVSEVKGVASAKFIDEDGVEHEVGPEAVEGWVQTEDAAEDSDD